MKAPAKIVKGHINIDLFKIMLNPDKGKEY